METQPIEIAIIDPNTLSAMGLRSLISETVAGCEVRTFATFGELMDDTPYVYAYYYVTSRVYFGHVQFFRERSKQSIVMVDGDAALVTGVRTLNTRQSAPSLQKSIASIHSNERPEPQTEDATSTGNTVRLSAREIEVCAQIARGKMNKEIASEMNISVTTVISHRKSVMEKLAARSVADVIVYAVMNGLVGVGEI